MAKGVFELLSCLSKEIEVINYISQIFEEIYVNFLYYRVIIQKEIYILYYKLQVLSY